MNEKDTLALCIRRAAKALKNVSSEIIVADNMSTDGSREIALQEGARVVMVPQQGYGHALKNGIMNAKGRYIVMGDADASYDFDEIPNFIEKLDQGYEFVMGCRLPQGGGRILKGAMPLLHQWVGNPFLSRLVRLFFNIPINDVYCGLRAFTIDFYKKLDLKCMGMDFATEMVIKSAPYRTKIAEIPVTLHKDGRQAHPSHLRTFRDGWRTLRLIFSEKISMLELCHGQFIHGRRAEVLSMEISKRIGREQNVLDVGCGDGLVSSLIQNKRPDLRIQGFDRSVREGARIPVNHFNGTRIPKQDKECDTALLVDVLHHTDDPERLLSDCMRVCKNTLIIKDHFCETAFDRTLLGFMDKIGNSRHGIASTGNYLSEKEWKVLFKKLGLRIIELKRGLKIHPAVIRWLFHSRLHFIAVLSVNNHENK